MDHHPSSAAWSMRSLPAEHVPPLNALCLRVFASNLRRIATTPGQWDVVKSWLVNLPDTLINRLFAVLRVACPEILSHEIITTYLLRGDAVVLTDDLPGVNRNTILTISRLPNRRSIRELHLKGLAKIQDEAIASVVSQLPALTVLNLCGCTKAGPKTALATGQSSSKLTTLNLNYTSVTPPSLAPLIENRHRELEVLKLAGLPNWRLWQTDATTNKLWAELSTSHELRGLLPRLRAIKLRQTSVTDISVNRWLEMSPNLRRLDLSFTRVRRPQLLCEGLPLEKLLLTSTNVGTADIGRILSNTPSLRILSLGALGGGQGQATNISTTSGLTLTDQSLQEITEMLGACDKLERVSLVGNSKLGTSRSTNAIAAFVRHVGRRCTSLNMAGIPSLRSSDLEGLLPDVLLKEPPRIRHLTLNNTNIDDEAALYLSSCANLQTLEVASTKITGVGLCSIISACSCLEKLNLTSCRGVVVGDRRRFFEVWEDETQGKEQS